MCSNCFQNTEFKIVEKVIFLPFGKYKMVGRYRQGIGKLYARYMKGICKIYVGYMLGIARLGDG